MAIQMTPARLVASAISASGGCGLGGVGGVSLTQLSVPQERGGAAKVPEEYRSRRSCLAVPGSSQRFLDKARGLAADEVFLDLEDAVAPAAKETARRNVIGALTTGGWGGKLVAVRVNDAATRWAYRDVVDVVAAAGRGLDAIILPKVTDPGHVVWLDLLLGQIEQDTGDEAGRIGIEAQIEDARGLAKVDEIAAASPRLRALVFGPADFMASIGMRSQRVGAQPAGYTGSDAYHYPLLRILVAARGHGLAAIDGPYLTIGDLDGLREAAVSAAALGYDGKWVLHPGQIDVVNKAFSPSQDDYERAELVLDAYRYYTTEQHRGAVMLGDEMIDEASRKLALVAAVRGRAAGLRRSQRFEPVGMTSAEHPPHDEGLGQSAGET
jgi:citrate lyase subunit beta / citryl-CoA lyase